MVVAAAVERPLPVVIRPVAVASTASLVDTVPLQAAARTSTTKAPAASTGNRRTPQRRCPASEVTVGTTVAAMTTWTPPECNRMEPAAAAAGAKIRHPRRIITGMRGRICSNL